MVLQRIASAKNLGSSTITSPKDAQIGKHPRPSGLAGSIPAVGVLWTSNRLHFIQWEKVSKFLKS